MIHQEGGASDPATSLVSQSAVIFFCVQTLIQHAMSGAISKMPALSATEPEILHAASLIISSCNSGTLLTIAVMFRRMLPCWIYQFAVQLVPGMLVSPLTSLLFEVWMALQKRVNFERYTKIDSKFNAYARAGMFINLTVFLDIPIGIICAATAYLANPNLM